MKTIAILLVFFVMQQMLPQENNTTSITMVFEKLENNEGEGAVLARL